MALLIGAVYLSLTASTGLPGQSHRYVKAAFTSVGGLRVGDDVRKASVRVGQVTEIALEGDHALVTMQLDRGEPAYRNARVAIQSRSALGQNFIAFDAGTEDSGAMPDGATIGTGRATVPSSLDEVLGTFDPRTRDATSSLLREVGGGLAGHSRDLHDVTLTGADTLRNLGVVTEALAAPSADLAGLLNETDALAARFRGRQSQVESLTRTLGQTLAGLGTEGGKPLEDSLALAPSALSSTRAALSELEGPLADVRDSMKALAPGARALGSASGDLRGLLRESLVPLSKVPGVADEALPAVESLTELMDDARPLAPRLETLFEATKEPAAVLAPYAPEISRFFTYWVSANRFRDASGHYLRIDLVIRPESVLGAAGVKDPLLHRNPYPAPGQAAHDRAATLLGGN